MVTVVSVPWQPSSAALVRRQLREALDEAGLPTELIDDATLVADELVGNALRHATALADEDLAVSWQVGAASVQIRVTDGGGPQRPRVRSPGPDETSGRGLAIVSALSAEWGVEDRDGTTSVWATLRS
jgi:serine/threonine-protein kinase RsbW